MECLSRHTLWDLSHDEVCNFFTYMRKVLKKCLFFMIVKKNVYLTISWSQVKISVGSFVVFLPSWCNPPKSHVQRVLLDLILQDVYVDNLSIESHLLRLKPYTPNRWNHKFLWTLFFFFFFGGGVDLIKGHTFPSPPPFDKLHNSFPITLCKLATCYLPGIRLATAKVACPIKSLPMGSSSQIANLIKAISGIANVKVIVQSQKGLKPVK